MILKDRVAVVTGAGSGIARSGAEIMAREGALVVVADRNAESGEETVRRIAQAGGRAENRPTDVTDDQALAKLIEGTHQDHGRIDILHNHAGIQVAGGLEEIEGDGMDASWRLNVRAHFMGCKLVVPHMKAQGGGSIINTASNSGIFVDSGMLAYVTSKAANIMMTRQIALDYAKFNIRVNALCPGWVDTPFNEPYIRQMGGRAAIEKYVAEAIPMGRWATTDEIAEAILFLASDRSSFMTGHELVVDGGEWFS
jgi:NAD(P)-dependent dehydrogenase (short-subunit alcohol dehydrogenase family)